MRLTAAFVITACAALPGAAQQPIVFLDLTHLNGHDLGDPAQAREAWDTLHLVASLQGIVNREAPRLFVRSMPDPDDFWWEELRKPGAWLDGRPVETVDSVEALLRRFAEDFQGVVVYDDRVPATSNLASTIAGVEDRLCLRHAEEPGSLCRQVLALDLPFTKDVVRLMAEDGGPMFTGKGTIPGTDLPSTGSAKCDAHLWAKARYLDRGLCSKEFMAYYIDAWWLNAPTVSGLDNATLTNHDFFISRKAFFFDLHVWEEESPIDDRSQAPGTDARTLDTLLAGMYEQTGGEVFQVGGFTPWAFKYTSEANAGGSHGGVDTEWKYAQMVSKYLGVMDADALGLSGMVNASFYQHHPLKAQYPQNPRPTEADLRAKGYLDGEGGVAQRFYVCFYMGDYDAASWLSRHAPKWWNDPAHGTIPCGWAFNPNLDVRAPHVFDYVRSNQASTDWFVFGDSGAGYLNPGMLAENDGWDAWVRHNQPYAERYDLSIAGFVIDGHSPPMGEKGLDTYLQFTPDGLVGQKLPPRGVHRGAMPYLRMALDLDGPTEAAGDRVAGLFGINAPKFLYIRTILKSPSWHKAVMERAREMNERIEFVDPYTFFALMKRHELAPVETPALADLPPLQFTPPNGRDGLAPIKVSDGPFHHGSYAGQAVLEQDKPDGIQYLYFEGDDVFRASLGEAGATVRVTVRLFDGVKGKIAIEYDAGPDAPYRAGPTVALRGSGQWRDIVFDLPGARFMHGQNGAADFRLVDFGTGLKVAFVRVEPG